MSSHKVCTKCNLSKPFSEFYKQKTGKHGLRPNCKDCINAANRKYAEENKERVYSHKKKYLDNNRDKHYKAAARWKSNNRSKANSAQAKRRAAKLKATPDWLTEDQLADIQSMYELAKKFEGIFGLKYEVDHIVPLQGENVCGLHVGWNLQILEQGMNRSKSNKHT